MRLLDPATRRLLERIRLPVRAQATAGRQGGHRSPVLATGIEFADHRHYVWGDDVRRIDWRAFARHRQLCVRQFEEERDARVYVLLDVSSSMGRGKPAKLDVAKRLAAAFCYLAMKQFDTARVVAFNGEAREPSRNMHARHQIIDLERHLVDIDPGGPTSFSDSVRTFVQLFPARGLVVILSDLMCVDGWDEGLRLLGGLGHQITVVRMTCDEDDRPDFRGELELFDSETGERIRVRMGPEVLGAYHEIVRNHVESCRDMTARVGGRFVEAHVDRPTEKLVRDAVGPAEAA